MLLSLVNFRSFTVLDAYNKEPQSASGARVRPQYLPQTALPVEKSSRAPFVSRAIGTRS